MSVMEAGSGSSALVLNCRAVATAGEGPVGGCDPPLSGTSLGLVPEVSLALLKTLE